MNPYDLSSYHENHQVLPSFILLLAFSQSERPLRSYTSGIEQEIRHRGWRRLSQRKDEIGVIKPSVVIITWSSASLISNTALSECFT